MSKTPDWQTLKGHVAAAFTALRKDGINARGPVGFDKGEAIEKVAKGDVDLYYAYVGIPLPQSGSYRNQSGASVASFAGTAAVAPVDQ
jgi:hypothetical protein